MHYLPHNLLNGRNDMPSSWKILLNLDTKSLVKVSKFIKVILKKFEIKSPHDKSVCKYEYSLTTKETKCGRKVVKPDRYGW